MQYSDDVFIEEVIAKSCFNPFTCFHVRRDN